MADDLDSYELIPAQPVPTGAQELDAATDLLDYDADTPSLDESAEPFGKTWVFDFEAKQFVRFGDAPAEAHGLASLRQWVLLCMEVDQGAHEVYDDDFGIEDLNHILGQPYSPALASEYERTVREALMRHDRISEISDFAFQHDPATEVLYVGFVIRTDEDETLPIRAEMASATGTY